MIKFDLIPTQAYWVAIGVLSLAVAGQQLRISGMKGNVATAESNLATEKAARKTETAERTELALEYTLKLAAQQSEHAKNTQLKENGYVEKIKLLEAERRAGAVTADRLRDRIATYAASDRRPGETDAAAVQRYANRLGVVSGLLSESVELVTEGRAILGQRDAEITRLLDQIGIDRAACSAPAKP